MVAFVQMFNNIKKTVNKKRKLSGKYFQSACFQTYFLIKHANSVINTLHCITLFQIIIMTLISIIITGVRLL